MAGRGVSVGDVERRVCSDAEKVPQKRGDGFFQWGSHDRRGISRTWGRPVRRCRYQTSRRRKDFRLNQSSTVCYDTIFIHSPKRCKPCPFLRSTIRTQILESLCRSTTLLRRSLLLVVPLFVPHLNGMIPCL